MLIIHDDFKGQNILNSLSLGGTVRQRPWERVCHFLFNNFSKEEIQAGCQQGETESSHGADPLQFVLQVGEDWEGVMECPDGVYFLPDNNVVVSDGPLDGAQSLQLFDISGKFIRCLVEVDDDDDISFSSISVDKRGRILVACNGGRPCVLVYSKDGDDYSLQMELGEGELESPEKAIFHDGKYFVSDSDAKKNVTMIKVFDKEGTFTTSFDEDKYSLGQRDNMGIDIAYPIRLTFDSSNNTLLAYHGIPREIRVLRADGSQVSSMKTVSGARDIALTKDKEIVATCGADSILSRSVQILQFNGKED